MSEVSTDKKLKGKDLITIGIFSAIYFVINFAFMLLGGIHPVLWMLMPGFIAVFAGIPFMLMVAKVQKLGAVFLMGLITALIYFVTGQFTLVILISMASTALSKRTSAWVIRMLRMRKYMPPQKRPAVMISLSGWKKDMIPQPVMLASGSPAEKSNELLLREQS